MGESTPASGDLGYIGAAGIVRDSRPSSTRPPTEVVSPHMPIHEGDVDGPPLLQRADLAPITSYRNPCPPTQYIGHVVDHFSKFHILLPLKSKSAVEVACNIEEHVFAYFGKLTP